jgi:hypothetical protein
VVSGAMPVVLTERNARTSAGISTGLFISGRAVGGSIAGAGFAALLTRVTIAHTDIPRQIGYVTVWLICAAASLVSLLIVATATRGGQAAEPGLLAQVPGGVVRQHDPGQLDPGGDGELGEGVP